MSAGVGQVCGECLLIGCIYSGTQEKGDVGMIEIRWHGRGGQGSFTVAKLLGAAAAAEGKFAQAFPSFGPERRGAPVTGFTRIDDVKIRNRSEAMQPDYVVVMDETVFGPSVTEGVKPGAVILINSAHAARYPSTSEYRTVALDATTLALNTLGRPISNVPMMAALVAVSAIVKPESVEKSIMEGMSEAIREKNRDLFGKAYQQVKGGV